MSLINKTITWATGLFDDGTLPGGVDWAYGTTTTYGGIIFDLSFGEVPDGAFVGVISNNTSVSRNLISKIYKSLTWEQMGCPAGSVKSVLASSYVRANHLTNPGGNIYTRVELWDATDTILKSVLIDEFSNPNIDWFNGVGVADYVINEPSSTQNIFKIWITGSAVRYGAGPGLFLPGSAQGYVDTLSLDIRCAANPSRLNINIAHGGI